MSPPTALILDGDLGLALALARELTRRHISAFPAFTIREARSMLASFHLGLDGLVINCSFRGACFFIEQIAKEHGRAKIIAIISERHRCQKCLKRLVAQFRDPEDKAPERIRLLGEAIQRILKRAAPSNRLT